ncbi:hypothetical protein HU200_052296 [Digitaria exilis]|uniref:Glycolipid transfer protein domain-containing protein n=1 Tax=Digitaria exilis TaxID=1010633 RepID=A0A835AP11_9POAL|nr:hypothetical protein HU200_052296 [Digitaria exilis]
MERKRKEMEKDKSGLRLVMEELCLCSPGDGEEEQVQMKVQEQPRSSIMDLLSVSKQLLHVLDEIGPTLLVLRQDIQQNIQRLQDLHERDSSKYASLTAVVTEEVEQGTAKKTKSCTRAIIWLSRYTEFWFCLAFMCTMSIIFLMFLLKCRYKWSTQVDKFLKMFTGEAAESSRVEPRRDCGRSLFKYSKAMAWLDLISCLQEQIVAMKLIPEREVLIAVLMGNCQDFEDLADDAKLLTYAVQPMLEEINAILVRAKHNLDKLKSS